MAINMNLNWSGLISNVTSSVMSNIISVPKMTVCSSLNIEKIDKINFSLQNISDTVLESRQFKLGKLINDFLNAIASYIWGMRVIRSVCISGDL